MKLLEKADGFLKNFLYKKHLKIDISLIYYTLFLFLSTVFIENLLITKIITGLIFVLSCVWICLECNLKGEINMMDYYKTQFVYMSFLVLFIILPLDSLIICFCFVFPISIYFLNLAELYLGNDTSHWPYIFHLVYGGLLLAVAFCIKEPIYNFLHLYLNQKTLLILRPFTLCFLVNHLATELVDLRVLFRARTYRDFILNCYDAMTGIPNRVGLFKIFKKENIRSIAMLDIDHFKQVNDTYGHDVGDIVLKNFASKIKEIIDENNNVFCCRWGGEEFIIVSNNSTDLETICIDLLSHYRKTPIKISDKEEIYKTFSCGIFDYDGTLEFDSALREADSQCYKAKETGRNKIYKNNEVLFC